MFAMKRKFDLQDKQTSYLIHIISEN